MNGIEKLKKIASEFYFRCEILENGDRLTISAHGFPQIIAATKKNGEEFEEFKILTINNDGSDRHGIPLDTKVGDAMNFECFKSLLEKARDKQNRLWNITDARHTPNGRIHAGPGDNEIVMF
jgi:hypothetical protein